MNVQTQNYAPTSAQLGLVMINWFNSKSFLNQGFKKNAAEKVSTLVSSCRHLHCAVKSAVKNSLKDNCCVFKLLTWGSYNNF